MTIKAPKQGKKFWEIVNRGCVLNRDPYNGDCDCGHGYEWEYDDCPCNIEYQKGKEAQDG
jgi:hypothetical protein